MSENTRYTNSWRHLTRLLTPGQVEHLERPGRCITLAKNRAEPPFHVPNSITSEGLS
jgi:hypothetical protein